ELPCVDVSCVEVDVELLCMQLACVELSCVDVSCVEASAWLAHSVWAGWLPAPCMEWQPADNRYRSSSASTFGRQHQRVSGRRPARRTVFACPLRRNHRARGFMAVPSRVVPGEVWIRKA